MKKGTETTRGKKILRACIVILCSAFAGSFSQIYIMIPNDLTSGGLPGITRMITYFTHWNYSLVYYICATLVVLLVLLTLGWNDVKKIIALSVAYPVMMYFMEQSSFVLLPEKNPILGAILVGVFYGVATGVGYIDGYSSGGTDSIARVLKYTVLKHVPISQIILILDGSIILISAFVFNRTVAFLALITVYINSKTTEAILLGISGTHVQVSVLTKDPESFTQFVMNEMGRGATSYISLGEYTKTERRMVEVICTPRESLMIKNFLAEHDDSAFVTVSRLSSVWGLGKGFSDIHEVDNN